MWRREEEEEEERLWEKVVIPGGGQHQLTHTGPPSPPTNWKWASNCRFQLQSYSECYQKRPEEYHGFEDDVLTLDH